MPNWITRSFKFIRDLPSRASATWPFRSLRKANISAAERELFERYGENVIAMQVSGSFDQNVEHARDWLTERTRSRQRRETITFSLEIVVVLLIGGEILLALWQGHLQSLNFDEQQQVLKNLQNSSAATAKTLVSLQSTTELMLHVSERAYVYATPSLRKPPSAGEKLQPSVIATNTGRTSALNLEIHSAAAFVPSSMPVNEALKKALVATTQTPASVTVLESGQHTEAPSESPRELNQSAFEQLMGEKMSLYVFSTLTYKDVFQQPHRTEICGVYQPKTNLFMNCHGHNKSD